MAFGSNGEFYMVEKLARTGPNIVGVKDTGGMSTSVNNVAVVFIRR